jgi:hypothetical protein
MFIGRTSELMNKMYNWEPGMVVHICNPSIQEVEAGGSRPAWAIQ